MDSVVLEVAVGLALLYYVTATLVSGVVEGLTRLMNTRCQMLWATLARILQDDAAKGSSLGSSLMFKSIVRRDDPRPDFGGQMLSARANGKKANVPRMEPACANAS